MRRGTIGLLAASLMAIMPATAQIDPAACTTATTLTYSFDLGLAAACYKGTVDHRATGGGSNTVTVTVDFPAPTPAGTVADTKDDVVYGFYVFDSTQGSDSTANWDFDTVPAVTKVGSTSTTMSTTSLQTRASSGFAAGRANYLYTSHVTAPSGRYTVTFDTDSARTSTLKYVVAIKKLSAADGHLAMSSSSPIRYTFKRPSDPKYVSLNAFPAAGSVYTEIEGYEPGRDGRLVQDLQAHASFATGIRLTSAAATGAVTTSATRVSTTSSLSKAEIPFPPRVDPRSYGGHNSGPLTGELAMRWSLDLYDTTGTDIGVDITVSPGPFLRVTPGNNADTFTEALVLSRGSAQTVNFDLDARSSDDTRAKVSHRLLRVATPTRWWSARFTMTGTPTDGTDSGVVSELGQLMGKVAIVTPDAAANSASAISAAISFDNKAPGSRFVMNGAVSTASGRVALASRQFTSTSVFDARLVRPFTYIIVCHDSGCGDGSQTATPTKITASIKVESVAEISGECSSNADCNSEGSAHPAEARAFGFSANGDPNRFQNCIMVPGRNPQLPETRCAECLTDCDCYPGQFCQRFTGVIAYGDQGVVVDEMSRLRAGTCVRKDLNNTQFGRPCYRPDGYSASTFSSSASQSVISSQGNVPFIQGQPGPVACGEYVYANGSYEFGARTYNSTGTPVATLWQGHCDGDGFCRECRNSQCNGEQICLDGTLHRTLSIDGTGRTLTNDTRAGSLLAIAVAAFFLLCLATWTCCCTFCCAGRKRKVGAAADGPSGTDGATAIKP